MSAPGEGARGAGGRRGRGEGPAGPAGFALCALAALCLALAAGCHHGQVRLRRSPADATYVWQDVISAEQCRAFYKGLTYQVKPRAGYAAGRGQEMEAFALNSQLRWNDAVRSIGGFFDNLCDDHNDGLVTLSEFEKRKAQLTDAAAALTGLKSKLDAALADYGKAWQQENKNRGAEGQKAAAAVAEARQQMNVASQTADDIIKKASAIVTSLRGPRATDKVMASAPSGRQP